MRRTPPLARALTEYRVRSLQGARLQPEFAAAVAEALPGTTVIDVGASVGNYALAFAKRVGRGGQVIALEANPDVYAELTASTWPSRRLSCINAAASDSTGMAQFYVPQRAGSSTLPLGSLEAREGETKSVEVPTLLLDHLPVTRPVSLVKIDVEGHEGAVLAGATRLLEEHHPSIVVEIEQRHLNKGSLADVVADVLALDYDAWGIGVDRLIAWQDFDVRRHQTDALDDSGQLRPGLEREYVNNFLFRPRSASRPTPPPR